MRHELYETLYICNSLYRIGNRIKNNNDFQGLLLILIAFFILALCYFLIPFIALYIFWTSNPKPVQKEEYLDNIKFLKILIPVVFTIGLTFLILIKTITLLQAAFIFIGLFDFGFILWVFEERIISLFRKTHQL
jgi:hypothetical protein